MGRGVGKRAKEEQSKESQRTMIGRQDHRGELPEQLAELGTFSPGHEQHPQREEVRCRVRLPMCWLPTGIAAISHPS